MVFLGYILPKKDQKIFEEQNDIALRNNKVDLLLSGTFDNNAILSTDVIPLLSIPKINSQNIESKMLMSPPVNVLQKINPQNIERQTTMNPPVDVPAVKPSEEIATVASSSIMGDENEALLNNIIALGNDENLKVVEWKNYLSTLIGLKNRSGKSPQIIFTGDLLRNGLPKGYAITPANLNNPIYIEESYNQLKLNPQLYAQKVNQMFGAGIKFDNGGVSRNNGERNFGKYHLSKFAFNRGNLLIYRPNTNSTLLSYKGMTPLLTKIVQDIKGSSPHEFKIDDYNKLNNTEKKVVEHIINLLRLDIPAKMERVLSDENYTLKSRYEILVGQLSAGNFGSELIKELKDVLKKMKINKIITPKKYNDLIKTLNDI